MGINRESLLISPASVLSNDEIISLLDSPYTLLNKRTEINGEFDWNHNSLIIGRNDNFTILFNGLIWKNFGTKVPSNVELAFCHSHVKNRMLAFGQNDTAMVYFYVLIEDAKRIRAKGGSESGIEFEEGEELNEEKQTYDSIEIIKDKSFYVKNYITNDENSKVPTKRTEKYRHEEIGGMMAVNIAKRIVSSDLDQLLKEKIEFFEYVRPNHHSHQFPKIKVLSKSGYRLSWCNNMYLDKVEFLKHIKSIVLPGLKEHQFKFDEENMSFNRRIGDITQIIGFVSPSEIGEHYVKLSDRLITQIQTSHLKLWYLSEFNSLLWNPTNPKNLISDNVNIHINGHVDEREIDIRAKGEYFELDELISHLNSYLLDTIIPFLDFYSSHHNIAHNTSSVQKVEYLLSIDEIDNAKYAMRELLDKIGYPSYKTSYNWIVEHVEARVQKYQLAENLEELFELPLKLVGSRYEPNKMALGKNCEFIPVKIENEEELEEIEHRKQNKQQVKSDSDKKSWWQKWL